MTLKEIQEIRYVEDKPKRIKVGNVCYSYDIITNDYRVEGVWCPLVADPDTEVEILDNTDSNLMLNELEKEYISKVITPFKEDLVYIQKVPFLSKYDCLRFGIQISPRSVEEAQILFEPNTMFHNLEPIKHYSLEDLGLK